MLVKTSLFGTLGGGGGGGGLLVKGVGTKSFGKRTVKQNLYNTFESTDANLIQ